MVKKASRKMPILMYNNGGSGGGAAHKQTTKPEPEPAITFNDICELYLRVSPTIKAIITKTNEESTSEKLLIENFEMSKALDPFADEELLVREEKIVLVKFLRLVLRFIGLERGGGLEKEVFLDVIDQVGPLFTYIEQIDEDIKTDMNTIINLITHNPTYKISNDRLSAAKQVEMEEWKLLSYLMYIWILNTIFARKYDDGREQRKYFAAGNFGEYCPTVLILLMKYLSERKKICNQQMKAWKADKIEQSLIVSIINFLTDYCAIFVRSPASQIEKEVKSHILPQLNKVFPKLLAYLYEISEPPYECIKISNFFTTMVVFVIDFLGKKALGLLRSLMQRDLTEVKDLNHTTIIPQSQHNSGTVAWIIKLKILNMLYALVQFTSDIEREQLIGLSEYLPMAVNILNVETYDSSDIDSILQNFSLTTCFAIVKLGKSLPPELLPPHFDATTMEVLPKLLQFSVDALTKGSSSLQTVCCDTIKLITVLRSEPIPSEHVQKILSLYHHDMINITPFRRMLCTVVQFAEDKRLCSDFFIKLFKQVREMSVNDEKFHRYVLLTVSLIFDNAILDNNDMKFNIELLEFVKEKIENILDTGILNRRVLDLFNSFSRILVIQCQFLGQVDGMQRILSRLIVSLMSMDQKSLEPILTGQDEELELITNKSAGNSIMLIGRLSVIGFLQECKRPEDANGQEFISKVIVPKIISFITKPFEEFSNSVEGEKIIWVCNTMLIQDICTGHILVKQLIDHVPVLVTYLDRFDVDDSSFYYEGLMKTFLLLFTFYPEEIAPILVRHKLKLFSCFNNSYDDVFVSLYVTLVFQVFDRFLEMGIESDFFIWAPIAYNFYHTFEPALNQTAKMVVKRVLFKMEAGLNEETSTV